ncbi:hypothetical protein KIW84_010210, partial [Lathyrus oleraceus]
MGYIALQGRSKLSILIDSLHDVDDDLKNNIWTDITEVFDVSPNDSMVKNKLLTYVGERWRGFKTQLTRDYITPPSDEDKPSYLLYSFINQDVWENFIKSRITLVSLAKSKK